MANFQQLVDADLGHLVLLLDQLDLLQLFLVQRLQPELQLVYRVVEIPGYGFSKLDCFRRLTGGEC